MARSHRSWQEFGEREPYFGVLTDVRFRASKMDPDLVVDFMQSGEEHVGMNFATIEKLIGREFRPHLALDFGCGVGRILGPLALRAEHAVGIDISPGMLREARHNCDRLGLTNVVLHETLVELLADEPSSRPDFIHSFIVFQHIEPRIGIRELERLLAILRPGGVAALHFTYATSTTRWMRAVQVLRSRVPGVHALINLWRGRPANFPKMQMNLYDLNLLFKLLQSAGVEAMSTEFTDHGGYLGVFLVCHRPETRSD